MHGVWNNRNYDRNWRKRSGIKDFGRRKAGGSYLGYAIAFLTMGINVFGSAFFTVLGNGVVSAAITVTAGFFVTKRKKYHNA